MSRGWVWGFCFLFLGSGWFGRGSDTARFRPEASFSFGSIIVANELHEFLELRYFCGGDFICFDVAVCVDAIVEAVATDVPAGTHSAIPFPVDSVLDSHVGKIIRPRFSLFQFEFWAR